MKQELITLLDCNLKCIDCKLKGNKIIIEASSVKQQVPCPYCGCSLVKIHSLYQREI